MKAVVFFIVLVFISSGLISSTSNSTKGVIRVKRIIGGIEASNQLNFTPSLKIEIRQPEPYNLCGGTIISKRHVLTAAHCVILKPLIQGPGNRSASKKHRTIYFSQQIYISKSLENDLEYMYFDETHYSTNRVYIHPNYNIEKTSNDIAIIELHDGFDFGIEPVKLPLNFVEYDNEVVFAAGYGLSYFQSSEIPERLQECYINIISPEECKASWSRPDPRRKICSGAYGKGTASGDSGGPIIKTGANGKWYQIGVISYGKAGELDKLQYPSVSTRVSFYCSWIAMVTKGEAVCEPYDRPLCGASSNDQVTKTLIENDCNSTMKILIINDLLWLWYILLLAVYLWY